MFDLFLGTTEIIEAKSLQAKLQKQGVEITFRANERTCSGSCRIIVELWGREEDYNKISQFFEKESQKNFSGLEVNHKLLEEVYDQSATEVICQACGHHFSPNASECPDCGLHY